MRLLKALGLLAFLLATSSPLNAKDDQLTPDQFDNLRQLIRPQSGESRWREVNWLTSLHEARVEAAAKGKPILLWSGGGASPLGGC